MPISEMPRFMKHDVVHVSPNVRLHLVLGASDLIIFINAQMPRKDENSADFVWSSDSDITMYKSCK